MRSRTRAPWRVTIDWMRVVLPPWWALVLFGAGLIGCELLAHLFFLQGRNWDTESYRKLSLQFHRPRDFLLGYGIFAYGAYRVLAMHPFYRPTYAAWLNQTPWRARLPLPLGPVHLVPQDVVLLLAAWLLVLHGSEMGLSALAAMLLFPYLIALILPLRVMGATAHAYAVVCGLAAVVWIGPNTAQGTVALVAVYAVAWHGLPKSFRGPAWDVAPELWEALRTQFNVQKKEPTRQKLIGFPILQLSSRPDLPGISVRESFLIAWLAAAWLSALASHIEDLQERAAVSMMSALMVVLIAAFVRAILYFVEYRPPISLPGRILTGRWFIWGFDRAWLPMGAIVLLVVTSLLIPRQWTGSIGGPALLGTGLTLALGLPPRLRDWALTGNHRLVPNPFLRKEFIEL